MRTHGIDVLHDLNQNKTHASFEVGNKKRDVLLQLARHYELKTVVIMCVSLHRALSAILGDVLAYWAVCFCNLTLQTILCKV